jgi:hypothetical protein
MTVVIDAYAAAEVSTNRLTLCTPLTNNLSLMARLCRLVPSRRESTRRRKRLPVGAVKHAAVVSTSVNTAGAGCATLAPTECEQATEIRSGVVREWLRF